MQLSKSSTYIFPLSLAGDEKASWESLLFA
jgi:hypothetical protein